MPENAVTTADEIPIGVPDCELLQRFCIELFQKTGTDECAVRAVVEVGGRRLPTMPHMTLDVILTLVNMLATDLPPGPVRQACARTLREFQQAVNQTRRIVVPQ